MVDRKPNQPSKEELRELWKSAQIPNLNNNHSKTYSCQITHEDPETGAVFSVQGKIVAGNIDKDIDVTVFVDGKTKKDILNVTHGLGLNSTYTQEEQVVCIINFSPPKNKDLYFSLRFNKSNTRIKPHEGGHTISSEEKVMSFADKMFDISGIQINPMSL